MTGLRRVPFQTCEQAEGLFGLTRHFADQTGKPCIVMHIIAKGRKRGYALHVEQSKLEGK
jgi:hypothetical protein